MFFTVTPDFPAVLRVWMICPFNGTPGDRPFALAIASMEARCFPFLSAHLAFIPAAILALAAALILPCFRRGAPFLTGMGRAPVIRSSSRWSPSIRSRIETTRLRSLTDSVVRRLLCIAIQLSGNRPEVKKGRYTGAWLTQPEPYRFCH